MELYWTRRRLVRLRLCRPNGRYACSKPLWRKARSSEGCIFIARNSSIAKSRCACALARSSGPLSSSSSASARRVSAISGRKRSPVAGLAPAVGGVVAGLEGEVRQDALPTHGGGITIGALSPLTVHRGDKDPAGGKTVHGLDGHVARPRGALPVCQCFRELERFLGRPLERPLRVARGPRAPPSASSRSQRRARSFGSITSSTWRARSRCRTASP